MDESFRSPTKFFADGGVIRTDAGRFVKTFAANMGSCSITRVEMRAIVEGLQLAWSSYICRIRFTPTRGRSLLFLLRQLS
ncbi:hypothetical protein LINGRAPRIM_LOCUS1163 [Linum grandiflorum]